MPLITFEITSSQAGILTFNDPAHLNAMSIEMAGEMSEMVTELKSKRTSLRSLILTGAGSSFSAGGDLEMLEAKAKKPLEQNEKEMLEFYHSFLSIRTLELPLIAAVNGHAIGAGLCLACACDFRVVSSSAKLGFTFTRLGLFPGMGATYFLPRVVGESYAAELMLTGRIISGEDVLTHGITNRLVDTNSVLEESKQIAREIAECGPEATRSLLMQTRGDEKDLESCLRIEAKQQAQSYASKEFLEGIAATREKREATW